MKMLRDILNIILLISIVSISTCGSKSIRKSAGTDQKKREEAILKHYSDEKKDRYAEFIVDISRYTSNGAVYHKKYYMYLVAIATEIIEDKKLAIVKGSIGFYFDRKSDFRSRLYLGLDIESRVEDENEYSQAALTLLKKHISNVIDTINSCQTIFKEKEVVGLVVGFRWASGVRNEQVNIWINEADVIRFENEQITFKELIQKSTITNTEGKIISLPI